MKTRIYRAGPYVYMDTEIHGLTFKPSYWLSQAQPVPEERDKQIAIARTVLPSLDARLAQMAWPDHRGKLQAFVTQWAEVQA